jgi:hypothetical protein
LAVFERPAAEKRGGNGFLFVYVRARWLYSGVLAVVEVPVLSSGDSLRGSSVALVSEFLKHATN